MCHLCPEYKLLAEGTEMIWEQLNTGNVRFVVFSQHPDNTTIRGLAKVQIGHGGIISFNTIATIPLNELTHELAVQWVKKLKTYKTFQ